MSFVCGGSGAEQIATDNAGDVTFVFDVFIKLRVEPMCYRERPPSGPFSDHGVLLVGKPHCHDGGRRDQPDGVDDFAFPRRREIALRELVKVHDPCGADECDDSDLSDEYMF